MNAKGNYEAYYDKFNYPCVAVQGFDDSARCMKMERVWGASFQDRDHDMIVVRQFLELCLDADGKMTSDGEICQQIQGYPEVTFYFCCKQSKMVVEYVLDCLVTEWKKRREGYHV